MGYLELRRQLNIQALWGQTGPIPQGANITIEVDDSRFKVHYRVMVTLSSHFQKLARSTPNPGADWRVRVDGVDARTVWRVLRLIYCQSCRIQCCPETSNPGSYSMFRVIFAGMLAHFVRHKT